jgi:LCP family protein required for cell wall assembly
MALMTRAQKITLSVLSVIACSLFLVVLYSGAQAYLTWSRQPLGPALDYPTVWQLPATWTATPGTPQPTITFAPTISFYTDTPASPFLPCADLPTMNLLVIGSDTHTDEYNYGRADVIRVVRVDFVGQRITALEFPRDLWVRIPEVRDDLGTDRQKLNTAYTYGNPGLHFWDHPSQGPGLLARTLDLNFGAMADHYVAVNMNVFIDLVDALGGLEITLPEGGIDGRTSTDRSARLVFPGGRQLLTGEQALTLARMRKSSVFERASYQNLVACALQEQVNRPGTITRIPTIINSFRKNIQTDLTPEQLSQLACLGTSMPRRNIVFASFPRELFQPGEVYDPVLKQKVFIWDSDFATLRDYVSRFNQGTWPAFSPFETPEPGTSSCD